MDHVPLNRRKGPRTKDLFCFLTSLLQLLIAAHIRGKSEKGSVDWRNGLPLCGTHQTAFDLHLFFIETGSLNIIAAPSANIQNIGIEVESLMTKRGRPHEDALIWPWKTATKAWEWEEGRIIPLVS